MKNNSRRDFVLKSTLLTGAALFPGWMVQGYIGAKKGLSSAQASGPKVIDKEIWFIDDLANKKEYRPMPNDPQFRYYSVPPVIKSDETVPLSSERSVAEEEMGNISGVKPVPFPWGHENFYGGNGGYITDNVYLEPGKPWLLQLAISTPGKGDTNTGSVQYKIWYRTSANGGKTFSDLKQVIVAGYTSMNPIAGVEIGRNGYNVDATRPIVRASNGEIMVPVCLHPWDEQKGEVYCPVKGVGIFQDVGVIIANWLPDGSDVEWKFGEWLRIDFNQSTRGLSEPSIVETKKPGRFAMVTRCSNSGRPELPGYAWVSFSNDYCRTWSAPKPFTYADGGNFFVPTACSAVFKLRKSGRVYWIGNLTDTNPDGSYPRFPLVIGEVEIESFGLIRDTVTTIDTRHPEIEGPFVQLSNFKIKENVEAEELLVSIIRHDYSIKGAKNYARYKSWYRIKL